jgi:hypothetical protein
MTICLLDEVLHPMASALYGCAGTCNKYNTIQSSPCMGRTGEEWNGEDAV